MLNKINTSASHLLLTPKQVTRIQLKTGARNNTNCIKEHKHFIDNWNAESQLLTTQFFEKWAFSKNIVEEMEIITNKTQDEMITHIMDHLTYNCATLNEANLVIDYLVNTYNFEKVEHLVFTPNQTEGYLVWLPKTSTFYRKSGTYLNNIHGTQGIFVRYMTNDYLKYFQLGNKIEGWRNISKFETSFYDMISQYQNKLTMEDKKFILQDKDCNKYLQSYLINGIFGHFALDVIALGTNLSNIENHFKNIKNKNQFALFNNWNKTKTVRQLYIYEKFKEIKNYNELREEPPEIFFELVERDEITSITANKIEKLKT